MSVMAFLFCLHDKLFLWLAYQEWDPQLFKVGFTSQSDTLQSVQYLTKN